MRDPRDHEADVSADFVLCVGRRHRCAQQYQNCRDPQKRCCWSQLFSLRHLVVLLCCVVSKHKLSQSVAGLLWLEVQTVVWRYLMAMLMPRWRLLCRAVNDGLAGPSFGSRKPGGMLVSPLPSPDSLLTVNFHTTSCLVQLP